MRNFKDLVVKPVQQGFIGDKISMSKILGKAIIVEDYRIEPSLYPDKGSGKRLKLQIKFKEEPRIIFTGSRILMETINQIKKEDMPFSTIIVEEGESFQFT